LGKAAAADLLSSGYSVKGSTTRESKMAELTDSGIEPHLLTLDPVPVGKTLSVFFSADILIVAVPPNRKSGSTEVYLEKMRALNLYLKGTRIQYVIFISSTSVYRDDPMVVRESEADPSSYLYQAERLFCGNSSIQTTVLRFGGLIGGDRHPGKFLAGKSGIGGRKHPVNLIHQVDCVKIIRQIIQEKIWNEVFNACCDVHLTREEFYASAAKNLKLESPVFKDDSSFSKIVNSDKLKAVLHFEFSNTLVTSYLVH
jgi:nucleoside-diphosphate-sugar epimerase